MRNFLLFFVFAILIFASCKKNEEEEHAPIITINTPLENQSCPYGDSIVLKGTITDQNMIKSVKITIYDQVKNVEVVPTISFTDVGSSYTLNCKIPVNNPSIETGLYYIGIIAHDGVYIKKHFIPIQITEMRKKLLGLIYLSAGNGGYSTNIHYLDTLYNDTWLTYLNGDYQTSELSSKYNKLFVAGALSGDLNGVDLSFQQPNWVVPNQSNQISSWFKNIYINNSTVYVSTDNGVIAGYTMDGLSVKDYACPNNWSAIKMLDYDNRFFAVSEKLGYVMPQMAQFYSSSSQFLNQQPLTFLPVKMYGKQSEQLIVFGNENSIGKSYIYYFLDNQFNVQTVFGSAEIVDVEQINNSQFLVLTTQGVLLYNTDLNVGTTMLSSITNGKSILYDSLNGQYFVIKPYQIFAYSYPEGTFISSITTSNQILKAHLYYNR